MKIIEDKTLQGIINQLQLLPYYQVHKVIATLVTLPEAPKQEEPKEG